MLKLFLKIFRIHFCDLLKCQRIRVFLMCWGDFVNYVGSIILYYVLSSLLDLVNVILLSSNAYDICSVLTSDGSYTV